MYRARVIELRGEDRSSILSRMGEMKRFCCLRDTLSMSDVEEIEVSIMWRMLPQFGDHSCATMYSALDRLVDQLA